MISASDRANAIKLINEATLAGAREIMACKELGISQRTLQRWKSDAGLDPQLWRISLLLIRTT